MSMQRSKTQRTMPLPNDILNNQSHDQTTQLMSNLRKISAKFKSHDVKHVYVSGLLYTSKIKENLLVDINRMIKELCMSDSYEYIDKDNIPRDMLYTDGLHLLDKGKYFLPGNLIENLNHFLETHVYRPTVRLETLI